MALLQEFADAIAWLGGFEAEAQRVHTSLQHYRKQVWPSEHRCRRKWPFVRCHMTGHCAVLCHASIHHEQAKLLFVWEWVLSFWTGFLFGFPTVLAYIIVALSLRYSGSLDSKDALSTFGSLSVAAASISQFIGAVCSIPYIISQLGSLVGYTNRVGQVVDALNVTHSLPSPSRPSSPLLRTVEVELTSPPAAAPDDTTLDGDTCQEATSTTPLLSLAHRTLLSSHQVWF